MTKNSSSALTLTICSLFFLSCASTHPGTEGRTLSASKNLDLLLSADWNADYSDDSNVFLDFNLENRSTSWVHVDQIDVDFPTNENVVHNVIVGSDLQAWAESYSIRKKKEDYNSELGIAGLIVAGTVLMVAAVATAGDGGKDGLLLAGATSYAAGLTKGTAKTIKESRDNANRGRVVPETHILAPMTLPSAGFAQRWMIINVPSKRIANFVRVRIHTAEGEEGLYEIPLVNTRVRSK